jgi:basic membrane lipoprotein Med (substrate-binding protein (PBP1-ABC) superfamily)
VYSGSSDDFTLTSACTAVAVKESKFGADILFEAAGPRGVGVLQTAGILGVYSIGTDVDQGSVDPSVIASVWKRVDVVTHNAIKAVVQGAFVRGPHSYGLTDGAVDCQLDNLDAQLSVHSTHLAAAQVHTDVNDALRSMRCKIAMQQATPPTDPAAA